MLNVARRALVDLGILDAAAPTPPFSARMSGNLGFLFQVGGGAFYQVKVGLLTRLDREFRGLSAGYAAMPRNVPEPLGLSTYGVHQILVVRGMPHRPALRLDRASFVDAFRHGLGYYFATSARAFARGGADGGSRARLGPALEHLGRGIPAWDVGSYALRIGALAAQVKPVLQHGDFAINNIGIAGRGLVFFDWEDFGEVDLPGYDLAMLLLSINGFSLEKLLGKLRRVSLETDVLRYACRKLDLAPADFLLFIPAYAALCIRSKSRLGYPAAVTDRFVSIAREWVRIDAAGGVAAAEIAQAGPQTAVLEEEAENDLPPAGADGRR